MRAQRLRDAGAEPIGLHQHRHERAHVVDLGALGEVLERLEARLAGARLGVDQLQLLRERGVGDLELFRALEDRLVEARPGFEADDQQVERIGQAVLDLLLARRMRARR